jgi:2-dehydro-3-deoxyphosphooctonate aldolase (KDO 8-P synthase)
MSLYDELIKSPSFFLLAGPCVLESYDMAMRVATEMKEITDRLKIPYVFKSSFDKANRSSAGSPRGPGLAGGLKILAAIKSKLNVPIITDIHLPEQAEVIAEAADILQIPAFLCRQTDLLEAAALTDKIINIKKAQFLAPSDMKHIVNKMVQFGNKKIFLCERGTCFGYNNLVVDMTGLVEMKKIGYPVVFDATHSVQKPGGAGDVTGGNREYVPYLARAAAAIGIEGFFMEVHPDPDNAWSDAANMVCLRDMEGILKQLKTIHGTVKNFECS